MIFAGISFLTCTTHVHTQTCQLNAFPTFILINTWVMVWFIYILISIHNAKHH